MIKSTKCIRPMMKSKSKKILHPYLEEYSNKHFSPLEKILSYESLSKKASKQKKNTIIVRSSKYSSPNSCQSSEIISKNQSREKKQI